MSIRSLIQEALADFVSAIVGPVNINPGPVKVNTPITNYPGSGAVMALKNRSGQTFNFYCEGTGGVALPNILFKHDIDNHGIYWVFQGDSAGGDAAAYFEIQVEGTGSNFRVLPGYPSAKIQTHVAAGAALHLMSTNDSATYVDGVTITQGAVLLNVRVWVEATTAAGQTVTNNAFTTVIYGTVVTDTASAYDATTGIFTAPYAGRYTISATAQVDFPAATSVIEILSLNVNGAEYARGADMRFVTATGLGTCSCVAQASTTLNLAAADTVKAQLFQTSGSNRTLNASATGNRLTILGPF